MSQVIAGYLMRTGAEGIQREVVLYLYTVASNIYFVENDDTYTIFVKGEKPTDSTNQVDQKVGIVMKNHLLYLIVEDEGEDYEDGQ